MIGRIAFLFLLFFGADASPQPASQKSDDVVPILYQDLAVSGRPADSFVLVDTRDSGICNQVLETLNEPSKPAFVNQPVGEIMVASRLEPDWKRFKYVYSTSARRFTANVFGDGSPVTVVALSHDDDTSQFDEVYFTQNFDESSEIDTGVVFKWNQQRIVRSDGYEHVANGFYFVDTAQAFKAHNSQVTLPHSGWYNLIRIKGQYFSLMLDWRFALLPNHQFTENDQKIFALSVFRSTAEDQHELLCVLRTKIRVVTKSYD